MPEHNKNFFSYPDLISTYWAGFVAADGCVSWHRNSFAVALAEKDLAHLQLLSFDLGYTGKLQYNKKTKAYKLAVYGCDQLNYDLENSYNIVPKKSLILKPPRELEIHGIDSVKSYIIGYIDGDGCIKFCKRDRSIILDIFSGSLQLVEWVKDFLETNYDLPIKKIYSYDTGHTYRIQGKSAIKVLSDLKEHGPRHLNRKWDKVRDYE